MTDPDLIDIDADPRFGEFVHASARAAVALVGRDRAREAMVATLTQAALDGAGDDPRGAAVMLAWSLARLDHYLNTPVVTEN